MKSFVASLILIGLLSGCNSGPAEPELTRLGDTAPAFGSTTELGTIQGFAVGKWTPRDYIDPIFAKQLGVGAIEEQQSTETGPIEELYELTADGRLSVDLRAAKVKMGGTWTVTGDTISLNYTTLNDNPIQAEKARLLKAAEGGTQGAVRNEVITDMVTSAMEKMTTMIVSSDKKMLFFSSSMPAPAGVSEGEMAAFTNLAGKALERLGTKPKS